MKKNIISTIHLCMCAIFILGIVGCGKSKEIDRELVIDVVEENIAINSQDDGMDVNEENVSELSDDVAIEDIFGEWNYSHSTSDGTRIIKLIVSEEEGHIAVEALLDDGESGGSYHEYDGAIDVIEGYTEENPEYAYEVNGPDYRYNRHYLFLMDKDTLVWVDAFYPEMWCQGEPTYVTNYYSK